MQSSKCLPISCSDLFEVHHITINGFIEGVDKMRTSPVPVTVHAVKTRQQSGVLKAATFARITMMTTPTPVNVGGWYF